MTAMQLTVFHPQIQLITPFTQIMKSRFAVIDTHEHIWADDCGGSNRHQLRPDKSNAGDEPGLPVCVRLAGPVTFSKLSNETRGRREEHAAPPDRQSPSFSSFLPSTETMARPALCHPVTIFVGAHVGWCTENLAEGRIRSIISSVPALG